MKKLTIIITLFSIWNICFSQAGTLDNSFSGNGRNIIGFKYNGVTGDDWCKAMAIQVDGKIVLAGYSNAKKNKDFDFVVTRLNTDGSLDKTFNGKGYSFIDFSGNDDFATAVGILADGRIVVAGNTSKTNGYNNFAITRLLSSGLPDISFGNFTSKVITDLSGNGDAYSLAIQSNNKIIVAGGYYGSGAETIMARYNIDGSLDFSFGIGGLSFTDFGAREIAHGITLQKDGKIIAGCSDESYALSHFLVARFNSSGFLDNTFGTNGKTITKFGSNDYCSSVAVAPNGKIVAAGFANVSSGFDIDFAVVRYNKDGTPDNTFSNNGVATTNIDPAHFSDYAYSVAVQSDEKIVLAGTTTFDFALVRYNNNGTLDHTFNSVGKVITDFGSENNETAYALKIQANGKIVAAGTVNAPSDNFCIARYLGDGAAETNNIAAIPQENKDDAVNMPAIHLYPNPVTNIIHVEGLNNAFSASYSINNFSGNIFQSGTIAAGNNLIKTDILKPGIYNLSILQDGRTINLEFIKQ